MFIHHQKVFVGGGGERNMRSNLNSRLYELQFALLRQYFYVLEDQETHYALNKELLPQCI